MTAERADGVAAEIGARSMLVDVADASAVAAAVVDTVERFERLDVMVNDADVRDPGRGHALDEVASTTWLARG